MRLSIIAFFILAFMLPSFAQQSIEIQGGINIAKFTDPGNHPTNATWSSSSNNGAIVSVSPDFILGNSFIFAPGLRFVHKGGYSETAWQGDGVVTSATSIEYFELPIYVKYELANFGPQVYLVGGPTISYFLSARYENTYIGIFDFNNTSMINGKDSFKKFDASLDLGLGLKLPINEKIAITGTGLYSNGLFIINKWDSGVKTRDIRAMIGVSFTLLK